MQRKYVVLSSAFIVAIMAGIIAYSTYEEKNTMNELTPFEQFLEFTEPLTQFVEQDVSNDGIPENYVLDSGRLTVTQENEELWQTPTEWWVDHFELADATRDDQVEITLSVWKSGSYGASKPFWVSEDDSRIKNHLFVFGFVDQKIQPIWQSSNLHQPNCKFAFTDINEDNMNELVVIEGEYTDDFTCSGKYLAVWTWREWGFYNDWRSEAGEYTEELPQAYIDQITNEFGFTQ